MNKKNISTILFFAGGFSILNGIGNHLFKMYTFAYLLFMVAIGVTLLVIGIMLRK